MKSYTDIEQSKKLAEILPVESADMYWELDKNCSIEAYNLVPLIRYSTKERKELFEKGKELIPCWSLAALLEQLPYPSLRKTMSSWKCDCYNEEVIGRFILGIDASTEVDACVVMIEKLNDVKKL